jgi:hypothetical protein
MLGDYLALIGLIGLYLYCVREWWPIENVHSALIYFGIMLVVMRVNGAMDAAPHKNAKRF